MTNVEREVFWETYWSGLELTTPRAVTLYLTAQAVVRLIRIKFSSPHCHLRILDLGCGDGALTKLLLGGLSQEGYAVSLVGCDLSSVALSRLQRNPQTLEIEAVQADANLLPLQDNLFDCVVSFGYSSVGSYRVPAIQREIVRVLRPSGVFLCDFHNILSFWFLCGQPRGVLRVCWRLLHRNPKTYLLGTWGLRRYFQKFGFREYARVFINSFPPVRGWSEATHLRVETWARRLHLTRVLGRVWVSAFKVDKPNLVSGV